MLIYPTPETVQELLTLNKELLNELYFRTIMFICVVAIMTLILGLLLIHYMISHERWSKHLEVSHGLTERLLEAVEPKPAPP
jgi:hypothetical protein